MKTYEQMAQDVLQRIDDINVRHRRRRQNTLRAAVALSCGMLTVLASVGIPLLMPKESTILSNGTVAPIATSVLQVAYLGSDGWNSNEMRKQVETQIHYKLSVFDVRDMTADKRQTLHNQLIQEQKAETSRNDSIYRYDGWQVNSGWENATFVLLRGGSFQLDIQEGKSVSSIYAECTSGYGEAEFGIRMETDAIKEIGFIAECGDGESAYIKKSLENGMAYMHAERISLDEDDFAIVQQNGELYVRWKPSKLLYEVLNKDPQKQLSVLSDEMVLVVHYTDGTWEEHKIELVFYDDGNINARYNGSFVYP